MMSSLPALRAGIYRHYKGNLYQVLGYGHDANADEFYSRYSPSGDGRDIQAVRAFPVGRDVVIYIGLQLDGAHTGPRLAVRTATDFNAEVHLGNPDRYEEGTACVDGCKYKRLNGNEPTRLHQTVWRFTYLGPSWEGVMADA
jgi:hypothetical protein